MARIAWLEDDADAIADVMRPLKASGHRIDTYRNVRDALDGVDELRKADVILLDILLPSGDPQTPNDDLSAGLNLLTEIRRLGVAAPVVVFSARSRGQHEADITPEMNIRDWIQKPESRHVLSQRVEAVLREAR